MHHVTRKHQGVRQLQILPFSAILKSPCHSLCQQGENEVFCMVVRSCRVKVLLFFSQIFFLNFLKNCF